MTTIVANALCVSDRLLQYPQKEGQAIKFDAIIIGSGQAGNPLSNALTDHGWTVAIVEELHLGGTCINHPTLAEGLFGLMDSVAPVT